MFISSKTREIERGLLFYYKEGPIVRLVSGGTLEDLEGVEFSFPEDSEVLRKSGLQLGDSIFLEPELVLELYYSPQKTSRIQMYPPSSNDWLFHIVDSGCEAIITIQKLTRKSKKFLTIVDKHTRELYHAQTINPYESNILSLKRDWSVHNQATHQDILDADIYAVLEQATPSWPFLSKLVEGVTIPNLSLRETMKETLDQLVPLSFSSDVRKQIIAFLGWLEKAEIPQEDPVDFLIKYRSVEVFRTLVFGHLQCVLDDIEPPNYIRVMMMADQGRLTLAQRPQSEEVEQDPWTLVRLKLNEIFPDSTQRVLEHIIPLQESGKIITELPISRAKARISKTAWHDRFALVRNQALIRGHVYKKSIGLLPVIYIGGAHTWPHKHLEWSARLGYAREKPQYIQIMVMPSSALERVSRVIPTVRLIDWEMSMFNLSLYSKTERKWKLRTDIITKSLERKRGLLQLANEFGTWRGNQIHRLSHKQAQILDMISWTLYLSSLESEHYAKFFKIDNSIIKQELSKLLSQGVFALQYYLVPENLRSLCIIATGSSEKICSMSRAFLKHTPSAQVRLMESGTSCAIVSRVPEDDYHNLIRSISDAANENEIALKTYTISAYAAYRNSLYSRLLRSDGSWDDDVSGLLSQVRLPQKNSK